MKRKEVHELTPEDFQEHPVWEYVFDMDGLPDADEDMITETTVSPATQLPVPDTGNCIVGVKLKLNNGVMKWAILGGILPDKIHGKCGTAVVAIFEEKRREWLSFGSETCSRVTAERLSAELGLPEEEIFPISYDIRGLVAYPEELLFGSIDRSGVLVGSGTPSGHRYSKESHCIPTVDVPEDQLQLLNRTGSFNVTVQGFYTRDQEGCRLSSHDLVIRPLLSYAKAMRVFGIDRCDDDIYRDIGSLGVIRDDSAEIDLSQELLTGHERLWNAKSWRRGSIVIAAGITDDQLALPQA